MNLKKVAFGFALFCLEQNIIPSKDQTKIVLQCPFLKLADDAGQFHGYMVDILKTRIDFIKLIQGEQKWSGVVIDLPVADSQQTISVYCQRPEIIYGATFVALTADHELARTIAAPGYQDAVQNFIESKFGPTPGTNTTYRSLYDRQVDSTTEAVFTGSYAINPINKAMLPIYISDYAIECFDMRKNKARLGIPAHNSKDFEFAQKNTLPITIVVDVHNKKDDATPIVAAPLVDKHGNLTEAYLGEYAPCILINSGKLNNKTLQDGAHSVIEALEKSGLGHTHTETLLYHYNNYTYAIKDLAKIETTVFKNLTDAAQAEALQKELKVALHYIQADFLAIGEKFLINVRNTKQLMIILIEEDCEVRHNNDCYLLQWARLKGEFNEKEVFRRDITSIKNFTLFCKDLVNFLGDFAHSCPKALDNIRRQS